MKNKNVNRRNFLHKLVGITALGGIASLILGNKVEKVSGAISGSISPNQIAYGFTTDVIGGSNHLRWDSLWRNFIGGWSGNSVIWGVYGATISGGGITGSVNKVTDLFGTVGGGSGNQAGDDAGIAEDKSHATVSGGYDNTASGTCSTVGGGSTNTANASRSTVSGGDDNTASGDYSIVGGGQKNTASELVSTVSGGVYNTASGQYSTVPGGIFNTAAGEYSFAAGRKAKANHNGAILFADSTDADFNSANTDEFAVRCANGARFIAGSSHPAVKGENSSSGLGIYGKSTSGTGVEGESSSSIGVRAESSSGTALHVEGKNYFKSAQRTTIPTGVRTHDITVPSGITIDTNAMIFVTLMNNSSNIGVRWVERLSDTQFRVHLTGLSRNSMNIGYFIVN